MFAGKARSYFYSQEPFCAPLDVAPTLLVKQKHSSLLSHRVIYEEKSVIEWPPGVILKLNVSQVFQVSSKCCSGTFYINE